MTGATARTPQGSHLHGSVFPRQNRLAHPTPQKLPDQRARHFIEPKVEAACGFAERSGRRAAIGALDEAEAVVGGTAGTQLAVARKGGVRP